MSFFPLLFILCVGYKTPSPGKIYGSQRYVLIMEHHLIVFSSQIFRLGSLSIHFFYFPHLFIQFPYLQTLKITFPPSIKGFQSLKRVWKHLFGSFHLQAHFLPFIDHFRFLNIKKTPKMFLNFNILTFFSVDSTST